MPLLVSLFTDCTPETSTEMMEIMREYGECVCCIGSCANFANFRQFSTADIALAVEPMYPRLCSNQPGSTTAAPVGAAASSTRRKDISRASEGTRRNRIHKYIQLHFTRAHFNGTK